MAGFLDHLDLETLDQQPRRAKQKFDLPSRLDERKVDIKAEKAAETKWRKGCIKRDGKVCRCCKRKVVAQLALTPERLEVHHIAGRADQAVRWDVRNGVVLCASCHEAVTRHRLFIIQKARRLFTGPNGKIYINANKPIEFKKKVA